MLRIESRRASARTPGRSGLAAAALLLPPLLLIAACGGGGGSGGSLADEGGIGGSGKPVLRIGALEVDGRVQIGGTTFDAQGATITIDGAPASESALRRGMVGIAAGVETPGNPAAGTVAIDDLLKGRIAAMSAPGEFLVLGQRVLFDETTILPAGGLGLGDDIIVYGFLSAPGVVIATLIQADPSPQELRLAGFVSNVDGTDQEFEIAGQVVDFGGADTSDLPGGIPVEGALVRVRGLPVLGGGGELVATRVDERSPDDLEDAEDAAVEKAASRASRARTCSASARSRFASSPPRDSWAEHRRTSNSVPAWRSKVVLSAGVMTASEIEFDDGVRIEADIAARSGNEITFVGLPGITAVVQSGTEFDGDAASLADLMAGDHVRVRGRLAAGTRILLTEVDERSASEDVALRAPVSDTPAPADPTFTLLGNPIDTTGFAESDFRDENDAQIGRSTWFSRAQPGVLVEASGRLLTGSVVWDEAELEDD